MTWTAGRRPLLALVATVAAAGVVACGGSSDSDGGGASAQESTGTKTTGDGPSPAAEADREAIVRLMSRLHKHYTARDGEAFCALLTAAGEREVRKFALTHPGGPRTCATLIRRYSGAFRQTPVQARSVEVKGDEGSITMRGGLAGIRSVATYNVSKENGEWRLEDPISGAETRRLGQ